MTGRSNRTMQRVCFNAVLILCKTRPLKARLQLGKLENFSRAAPGESETGAAVAVIVNDGAAITFQANA